MDELIQRWQRAAERADDEKVRVVSIDGQYYATSSSRPLLSYRLSQNDEGWGCECVANAEYRVPCKHLWVLSERLDLDPLTQMRVEWPPRDALVPAA